MTNTPYSFFSRYFILPNKFVIQNQHTIFFFGRKVQYGYRIIDDMISGMQYYMRTHGIHKIQDLVGKALPNIVGTDELDRDTVCYPKFQTQRCIGCGRCYLSCYDGGHQAILPLNGAKVRMDAKKCVGCHLCLKVCPVGAIIPGTRVVRKK